VKSMQGRREPAIAVEHAGVVGDRIWGLLDGAGKLASAKRYSSLLMASATDSSVTLPGGDTVDLADRDASAVLSRWLGTRVTVQRPVPAAHLVYQMTFDPTNDHAELVDIPVPSGTFLDWAPLHLVSTATLDHCSAVRPELDWDVRRFRPNVVAALDVPAFAEDSWAGKCLRFGGGCVASVRQPTVRCSIPLRAQPGLSRRPALFNAMSELNRAFPNHLGIYLDVAEPGHIEVGDRITLIEEGLQ
jgi:uncharacterized protein